MDVRNNIKDLREALGIFAVERAQESSVVDAAKANSQPADQTSVSAAANLVNQAIALPDVRTDKVAQVQQALEDGTYKVDSTKVAGKIIDSMLGK